MNENNTSTYDAIECFARIDCNYCNALTVKNCKDCKFFKSRNRIKNNPFYGYSYEKQSTHVLDMKRYKVNPDDVLY